ncbi:MAG: hypothetical protein ACWGNI_00465 [Desulfobacterales bacterium]
MKWIINFIKWYLAELDKICPNCGYYCTGKSIYCNPPIEDSESNELPD